MDPQQALDALQREINLIVRLALHPQKKFQNDTLEAALARASRLKQQLPVSNNRFHQALDVLDEKLVSSIAASMSSIKLTNAAIDQSCNATRSCSRSQQIWH
jgi:pyruvate-formate lyase-activating enzyme